MQHNFSNKLPKHRHETSMDNFIKNIKKYNQRSERYMSPPLLYMYSRNHTTNTLEKSRSRTLSNRKSSGYPTSKLKKKIDKILNGPWDEPKIGRNPAYIIEECGEKLKKVEKYLEKKNQIGCYLVQNFYKILNDIVAKMVENLDFQLQDIESKTMRRVESRYKREMKKIQKVNTKLSAKLKESEQKLENNSNLIYQLRKINQIDLDYVYGRCILNTDACGGFGYGKADYSQADFSQNEEEIRETSDQYKFVAHKEAYHFEKSPKDGQNAEKPDFDNHEPDGTHNQIESGRIKPVQAWQKSKNFPQSTHYRNEFDDSNQSHEIGHHFGRRLT